MCVLWTCCQNCKFFVYILAININLFACYTYYNFLPHFYAMLRSLVHNTKMTSNNKFSNDRQNTNQYTCSTNWLAVFPPIKCDKSQEQCASFSLLHYFLYLSNIAFDSTCIHSFYWCSTGFTSWVVSFDQRLSFLFHFCYSIDRFSRKSPSFLVWGACSCFGLCRLHIR